MMCRLTHLAALGAPCCFDVTVVVTDPFGARFGVMAS